MILLHRAYDRAHYYNSSRMENKLTIFKHITHIVEVTMNN